MNVPLSQSSGAIHGRKGRTVPMFEKPGKLDAIRIKKLDETLVKLSQVPIADMVYDILSQTIGARVKDEYYEVPLWYFIECGLDSVKRRSEQGG